MSEKQILEFLLESDYETAKEYQAEIEQIGEVSINEFVSTCKDAKAELHLSYIVSLKDLERLRLLTKLFTLKGIKVNFNDTGDLEYVTNLTQEIYMGMKGLKDEQDNRRGGTDR